MWGKYDGAYRSCEHDLLPKLLGSAFRDVDPTSTGRCVALPALALFAKHSYCPGTQPASFKHPRRNQTHAYTPCHPKSPRRKMNKSCSSLVTQTGVDFRLWRRMRHLAQIFKLLEFTLMLSHFSVLQLSKY